MTIELRVLSGARAGHRATFEGGTVTIGRHPDNTFQLDPEGDRDVSSRHAELHVVDGQIQLTDLGSTNGTFVNGTRIREQLALRHGDVVQLGAEGPRVEVRVTGADVRADARPDAASAEPPRRPTAERIALAVRAETSRMKKLGVATLVLLAGFVLAAYWLGARESAAEVAEMRRLLAGYDSTTLALQARLEGVSDTAVIRQLRAENDALRRAAAEASRGSDDARDALRERVSRLRAGATALAQVDLPAINERNAPAVAYLVSEVGGKVVSGTAFAVAREGLLVTNRHLVRAEGGAMATRIAVKFRDSRDWITARVVRVAQAEDDDLALLQIEHDAPVPVVAGISGEAAMLREGAPVVTIGYPLGRSTRMEGDGDDFVAKTSLYPGTVSKRLAALLQVAAYAGHGSSGSPVFDASGRVAGVVWGGPRESAGQLVYAVPAERLAAFIGR